MRWGRGRVACNCTIKPNGPAAVRIWDSFCFVKPECCRTCKIGASLKGQTPQARNCPNFARTQEFVLFRKAERGWNGETQEPHRGELRQLRRGQPGRKHPSTGSPGPHNGTSASHG